jgi:hypothetical protein
MLRRKPKVQFDCVEVLRQAHEDSAPRPIQVSDSASVESSSLDEILSRFSQPFEPAPIVPQSVVLCTGVLVFLLALIWPPLILLVTYICSKLIPYSFRENDEASSRRQLFHEFSKEEDLPDNFKLMPDQIRFEEEYIVNERCVTHNSLVVRVCTLFTHYLALLDSQWHAFVYICHDSNRPAR